MTIDERGTIYLTGDGVTVFDKDGQKIAHFPIPEDWTANACFGGKERNILFITASKSVYTLKMLVRGVDCFARRYSEIEKTQIHLAFCSLIRIFASEKEKDDGNTRCKIQTLRVAAG